MASSSTAIAAQSALRKQVLRIQRCTRSSGNGFTSCRPSSICRTFSQVRFSDLKTTTAAAPFAREFGALQRERSSGASSFSSLATAPAGSGISQEDFLDDPVLFHEVSADRVRALAIKRPTPLRLADLYRYGASTDRQQRIRNAQFLHKELPIRVAQRVFDLLTLPHGLSESEPIREVASIYLGYLKQLLETPLPVTEQQEEAFTDLLQSFVLDRGSIPTQIAQGVHWWYARTHSAATDSSTRKLHQRQEHDMEEALYRFFTARAGLRFLTEHHVLSSTREANIALRSVTHMFPVDDQLKGLIQTNCDVVKEIRKVAEMVHEQTTRYLVDLGLATPTSVLNKGQRCPEIQIFDGNKEQTGFTYVPHHLHYMMAELLKNSVRATIRQHVLTNCPADEPPAPIKVVVAKGEEDVTIKIADRGGGIPRSRMQTIWKFAHSTAPDEESDSDFGTADVCGARIRGFGLPLARIYARYFGGELTLKSTEGYGLDAYLYLPRLGESCEKLPPRVRDSPGERDSLPWSADIHDRIERPYK